MKLNTVCTISAVVVTMALPLGFASVAVAEEEGHHEIHMKKVHKVVVDCDEDSGEDCERQVHVKVISGDHDGEEGEHSMVWVQGGDHGLHYNFDSGMLGTGGFLGIQLTDLTPELRAHFGVAEDEGVMVAKVVDDSAAFRAGLAAGDIITRVDEDIVGSSMDLTHAIRSREEGESVSLEVWRDGSFSTFAATLDQAESPHMAHSAIFIDCDDDEGDCDLDFSAMKAHDLDIDCPDGEQCDVKIKCDGGDCECTVNGEIIDCPELHGVHHSD